jgi:hypothetical protein
METNRKGGYNRFKAVYEIEGRGDVMKKGTGVVFIFAMIIFLASPLPSDARNGSPRGGGPSVGRPPAGGPSVGRPLRGAPPRPYYRGAPSRPYYRGGPYHTYYRGWPYGRYYWNGGWYGNWAIGGLLWYPYFSAYYPYYPYYYAPYGAEVASPSRPQEYVERTDSGGAGAAQPEAWRYCPESGAYYPYVKECPGGWQTVPATPQDRPDRSGAAQPGAWYYCREANAYYPYVRECPGGWQTVTAQPPSETGN